MSVLHIFACFLAIYAQLVSSATLNTFGRALSSRQTEAVPPECKTTCDPVNAQLAQQCPPALCCADQFEVAYSNCLQCVGQGLNVTDFSPAQNLLDGLIVACSKLGLPIQKLTLPGQDPGRVLSTASVSPSSTGTSPGTSNSDTSVSSSGTTSAGTTTSASKTTIFPSQTSAAPPTPTNSNPAPANTNAALRLAQSTMEVLFAAVAVGVYVGL